MLKDTPPFLGRPAIPRRVTHSAGRRQSARHARQAETRDRRTEGASSKRISSHRSMHSSQIQAAGAWMSLCTSSSALLQNEQRRVASVAIGYIALLHRRWRPELHKDSHEAEHAAESELEEAKEARHGGML